MIPKLEEYLRSFNEWLNRIGMFGMFIMAAITIVDVVGSKVFTRPLFGADEILGAAQVVAISSGLAFTQILKGHTEVDFFADKMGKSVEGFTQVFAPLAGLFLFIILSWNLYSLGASLRQAGEVTSSARLPLYPFIYYMAFCFAVMCVVLFLQFLSAIVKTGRES